MVDAIEVAIWVVIAIIALIGIRIFVRTRYAVGPEYDMMREELEGVRKDMQEAEALGATEVEGKRLDAAILQFNGLASRLRVEKYGKWK